MPPSITRLRLLVAAALLAVVAGARDGSADPETASFVPFAPQNTAARASTSSITPPPPPDLTGLIGLPIARVRAVIDGASWEDVRPPSLASIKIGEPLTTSLTRRVLDEALATGLFARGEVSAKREGDGVTLVVSVTARKLIQSVRVSLHGASLDREEVLHEADLVEGGELVGSDLSAQTDRIAALFARHGYPNAKVSVSSRATDDPKHAVVLVDVDVGNERDVELRWFYVEGASRSDLRKYVDGYSVKVGDRTDEPRMTTADADLETKLRANGWYGASVFHDLGMSSGKVTLRVRIDTGAKTVFRFEGNDNYDTDALTGALNTTDDPDRTPSHLVEKLEAFYAKRGFYDVDVSFAARGGATDPDHVLVFKIAEGRRVHVTSRVYPCLRPREIDKLAGGGPRSAAAIGTEIDSYLEDELPGADFFRNPSAPGLDAVIGGGGGSRPRPGRARSGPHARPRHVRPRALARPGALSQRRVSPRDRRAAARPPRDLHEALSTGGVRRPAAPARADRSVHVRSDGDPCSKPDGSARSTPARRTRRTASSARRTSISSSR